MRALVQTSFSILVIDDSQTAEGLRLALTDCAIFEVTGPHDLAERFTPDACIVGIIDPDLPWLAGYGGMASVVGLYPETSWILHTSAAEAAVYAEAINQGGVVRCLRKPSDLSTLQTAVLSAARVTSRLPERRLAQKKVPPPPNGGTFHIDLAMNLLDHTAEVVLLLDRNGTILYVNEAVSRAFGVPPSELIGRPLVESLKEIIVREDEERFSVFLEAALADEPVAGKTHFRVERGEQWTSWLEATVADFHVGPDGQPYVVLLFSDISAVVWNERNLAESEQRFRRLSEVGHEAIVIHDGSRILDANSMAATLFGGAIEDLIGTEILDYCTPEDRPRMVSMIRSQSEAPYEVRLVNSAGGVIPVEIQATLMQYGGRTLRVASMHNLTAERAAEEQLLTLSRAVEFSPVMVMVTNPAGKIIYVNPKFTEVSGYTAEEVIGKSSHLMDSAQNSVETYQDFLETVLSGQEWRGELARYRKDGGLYWESMRVTSIRDASGRVTHLLGVSEEITTLKQQQDALRASEERFRIVSELTSDFAFSVLVTPQRKISFEWWTDALVRITGYTPAEMLEHWQTVFHPDDMPAVLDHFRAFVSGRPAQAQFRIVNPDGEVRWVSNSIFPERVAGDDGGMRMICAGRDITEEKLAMQAVHDSEMRFRLLFEASADSIAMVDLQGDFLLMNEQTAQLLGYESVVDVLAVSQQFLDFVSHEDRHSLGESLRHAASGKSMGARILRLLRRDGTSFLAETNAAALRSEDGAPVAFIAITRDITDRVAAEDLLRRSQEQYRMVSELTSDYAFALGVQEDGSLYLEWESGNIGRITGHMHEQVAGYEHWLSFLSPDDIERVARSRDVVFSGMPTAGEIRFWSEAGEDRICVIYLKPFWDQSQQRVTRVFGAARDVTEERRAEKAQLAQAKTIAALEERQALARDLHDAVSQSLFSANILAEMLIRTADTRPADQLRSSLSQLHQLTRSAQAEMRTLLLELRPKALEDTALVELIANLALAAETRSGADVQVEVDSLAAELPVAVKLVFYRVVQEALNNAVKHARASRIVVRLLELQNQVQLIVSDDGQGFDSSQVAADRMGLKIMQERAESLGASFGLQSKPGEGTELVLTWPRSSIDVVED